MVQHQSASLVDFGDHSHFKYLGIDLNYLLSFCKHKWIIGENKVFIPKYLELED